MSTPTNSELLQGISDRLDGILALMAAKDCKGDVALIVAKLRGMGMSTKTIALVAGITENAVAIRLSRLKKPTKSKAGKQKKSSPTAPPSGGEAPDSDNSEA